VATNGSDSERLSTIIGGAGPRVVLVHGFTQNARCWGPFADSLAAAGHQLVSVDAPGHGRSSKVHADIEHGAQLIGEAGGPAVYIGYSMGARYALRLALDRPELVHALVLIGGSPGIEDASERAQRRAEDDARAAHLEDVGVERFVDEWLQLPMFATLPADNAHRQERVRNTVAGLASSLRLAGTGAMEPLWDRLGTVSMPVALMTGDRDPKFTAIAERMLALMTPHAWGVVAHDAGHSVHLEQPVSAAQFVVSWLRARRA
jgi:2-succinyl-6-hydroxy-2,4-cyclohexadiene-1-carboxylate synthase